MRAVARTPPISTRIIVIPWVSPPLILVAAGFTGYLSSVRDLLKPASQWKAGGVPLTMMMNLERRHGKDKPVIQKALVDLKGKPFKTFASLPGKMGDGG